MITRFFSTGGRIGVIRFLIASFVALAILFGCRTLLATASTAAFPLIGALAGATLAKLFAEGGRRCHDLGRSGVIGLVIGICILMLVGLAGLSAPGADPGTPTAIGAIALALTGTVLFLLPGQKMENAYGAPPRGPLTATQGPIQPVRTLSFTALAIIGATAVGVLLATISDGMREENEHRVERMSRATAADRMPAR
ncbi:MAG: DUF805 domain-containing protein [Sphingomonas sp.]|nr:MAG: DUF805 domain-containing protein [Sphingomonas sp.]